MTCNQSQIHEARKQSQHCTHRFEEKLEDATRLFVDQTGDTLHTTTTSEATNGLNEGFSVMPSKALYESDAQAW